MSKLMKHAEFQAEYPLSLELPYWDFFEDQNITVLADGTLVQGLKLVGLSLETSDAAQINQVTTNLRTFLNSLPDEGDVQFFVDVNSDFNSLVQEHSILKGKNPLVAWVSDGRVKALRSQIEAGTLQKTNLYLFIYLRVKSVQSKFTSFFSKPKLFTQSRKEEFEQKARELSQLTISIQAGLQSTGVESKPLTTDETQKLIYRILNPMREKYEPLPAMQTEHRLQEFSIEEIARESRLAVSSPREQLAYSDLIQGTESFFLDGFYHRVVTLKNLPEFTHSSMVSRLMGAALAMVSAPTKAAAIISMGRDVLSNTGGFAKNAGIAVGSKMWDMLPPPSPPLIPPGMPPIQEPLPVSHQLPAPPVYMGPPAMHHGHDEYFKKK